MDKITLSGSQNLDLGVDFRGRVPTFRPDNAPKKWPAKAQKNDLVASDQPKVILKKSKK